MCIFPGLVVSHRVRPRESPAPSTAQYTRYTEKIENFQNEAKGRGSVLMVRPDQIFSMKQIYPVEIDVEIEKISP